ncbi:MAG: Fur family transcriptional regulator [Pirellulaceae bacterium]|jgi:Fur family ferric uptake transcriptional regulator|nr:Fur family transcriptional regulator [Pirellulaceae bacterium]MDP7304161.1 Fur family transcriptional regulator [Pirellulaceae bacterium]HJN08035.1 Fur family transcriptional regulator [Pirellulaceae bacterium]
MAEENSLGSVDVSQSPAERFEEFLQSRGKRMTQSKRQLLDQVYSCHVHFDAESLIEQLPASSEAGHIGRATVYRVLNEFVDAGLLREFKLDGRRVYEHDYGYPQHDHLYCTQCQQLIEFESDQLLNLVNSVARERRFRVSGHRLIISGICQTCRQSKRRSRKPVDMV